MDTSDSGALPAPPRPAHAGWRLLALTYDLLPALAIWFAVAALWLLLRGGEPVRPGSASGWLELLGLWLATGAYAVLSWRRGGQTLGMRAWRLRLAGAAGRPPPGAARLWLRYAVSCLSLLPAGLGFFWALFDRRRRTWHDLAAGTRVLRERPRVRPAAGTAGPRASA